MLSCWGPHTSSTTPAMGRKSDAVRKHVPGTASYICRLRATECEEGELEHYDAVWEPCCIWCTASTGSPLYTVGVTSVPLVSLDTPPHSSSPPSPSNQQLLLDDVIVRTRETSSSSPPRYFNPAPLSICSSPDRCVFSSSWLSRFQHCNPEPSHRRLVIYPCISSRCPVTLCCLVCGLSPVSLMSVYVRLPNLPPGVRLFHSLWSPGRPEDCSTRCRFLACSSRH